MASRAPQPRKNEPPDTQVDQRVQLDPHRDPVGVLHEVSNALTVLLGWIAEARDPQASSEDAGNALRIVEARARVARDLARRAIGARVIPAGDADLRAVLRDVIESLAVVADRAAVRLTLQSQADARLPLGEDVGQILTNLVLNGVAHTPAGGEVRIVASRDGSAVVIDVADDGPGIESTRRATVFEGDTRRHGGAGVGLRHARAMARAAGGDLVLCEDRQGARFRLTWPEVDSAPQSRSPRSLPRAPVLDGARILILEDDIDVTTLLEAALSARGAIVTIARTAKDLRKSLDDKHDAVLIDLSPIASDVPGAMALLDTKAQGAAIVFITGSAESLPATKQAARWVRKPFEVSEIVDAILGR